MASVQDPRYDGSSWQRKKLPISGAFCQCNSAIQACRVMLQSMHFAREMFAHFFCVAKGPARQEMGMVRKGFMLRAAQGQNVSIGFDFHPTMSL